MVQIVVSVIVGLVTIVASVVGSFIYVQNYVRDEVEAHAKTPHSDSVVIDGNLPVGALVAFDREGLRPGGCAAVPGDWEDMGHDFEGRFVLIAGARDGGGDPFAPGDGWGEYEVTLTVDQMPAHDHEFRGKPFTRGGYGGSGRDDVSKGGDVIGRETLTPTGAVLLRGGNEPHNNMPPFIALTWCRKL